MTDAVAKPITSYLRLPAVRPGPGIAARPDGGLASLCRALAHLVLAALPLLSISAQVFGLLPMSVAAVGVVLPLFVLLATITLVAPERLDRIVLRAAAWGAVACAIYDGFRLFTVHVMHWWGDFIPTMGTWIIDDPRNIEAGALVGYLWRYLGDAGGIGVTFFTLACAVGLFGASRRVVVSAAVAFAVCPVWAGLIATVALAPRGQQMMFPVTATTTVLSLIGHLIFGTVLGLGFWRSRHAVAQLWPWPALPALLRSRTS